MSLAKELTNILNSCKGERPLLGWLKENPLVLTHTLRFCRYAAAEFPFGTDFRADFVVLGPFSGGFNVHFIELEPPDALLFTKNGTPAKRLAGAIAQVDSWRLFIERNRSCVLRDLAKFVQHRELIFKHDEFEPMDNGGWPLYHPQLSLSWSYDIIIGRRHKLTAKQIEMKASYRTHHEIEILTYDRLIEAAQRLDDYRIQRAKSLLQN